MSKNKQLVARFEKIKDDTLESTLVELNETLADKRHRIESLLHDYNAFSRYYFPNYCTADLGKFHKSTFRDMLKHRNTVWLLQWSREFAKSVHSNIIFPIYLLCRKELTGMIVGCANEDDAIAKLSDLQAVLQYNQRIINDFGQQFSFGNWEDGNFSTKSGVFFRAFGRKQSPRGVRFRHNRPNYGVVDDIDTKALCKNDKLSKENYDWVKEDFMAALSINEWWLVVAENKFHKNTVTAQFEADKEIKVKLSRVNLLNDRGESNWPEHINTEAANTKIKSIGTISAQREYFNNPIEEGTIFTNEQIVFGKMLPLKSYDYLITYTDPSYKNTDKSDYKATLLIGKTKLQYHVIKAFVDRVSIQQMFNWMYDINSLLPNGGITHYMEANFLQDLLWSELHSLAKERGFVLPINGDKRAKPDKFQRIEALQPLFERGLITFNKAEEGSPGMVKLVSQLLGFERGNNLNDDAPDALEGGIFVLNQKTLAAKPVAVGARSKSANSY